MVEILKKIQENLVENEYKQVNLKLEEVIKQYTITEAEVKESISETD